MDASPDPRTAELLAHSRWIEALAIRLVGDPSVADDVVQSTWLAALRTSSPPRGNVRSWLSKIAGNVARETHRRESQRADVERNAAHAEHLPSSGELAARAEAEAKLVEAVLTLEEPHRELLLLRYFEGLRPEEIARRSGVPASSVSKQLTRAHARLRERLEERGISLFAALAPILGRSPSSVPAPLSVTAMSTAAKVAIPIVLAAAAALVFFLLRSSEDHASAPPAPSRAVAPPEDSVAPAEPLDLTRNESLPRSNAIQTDEQPPTPDVAATVPAEAPAPAAATTPTTGRIFGLVLRPDGKPAASRRIRMIRTPGGPTKVAIANDEGRFDERELPPGRWSIFTACSKEELALLGLPADTIDMETMSQRILDLPAGAEVEIELGRPPANPIRVTGRVNCDPLPEARILMQWIPEGEDGFDRAVFKRAAKDGSYEVTLAEPGPYVVSMIVGSSPRVERLVDVPSGSEFAHDLEIASGRVRGRVLTASGEPVARAIVELTLRAGHRPVTFMSTIAFSKGTDREGRFSFDHLDAARYTIGAYGGVSPGGERVGAIAPRDIVVTDSSEPIELELVAPSGHAVRGRVVDPSGGPINSTHVFVFDASGNALNPIMAATSDKNGAFALPPLPPGHYSVVGASGARWSDFVSLDVTAQNADIELTLREAARLDVTAEDLGEAWIDVRDSAGRCLSALLDRNLFNGVVPRVSWQSTWRYYVPAGEYEVRAVDGTGAVIASTRVSAAAGESKRVTLAR